MLDAAHRVFDTFGPHRMFWGSDLSRLPGRYIDCVRMFTEHADWLQGDDLATGDGQRPAQLPRLALNPPAATLGSPDQSTVTLMRLNIWAQ
jgi:hypothetical protein